jgi:hypothetical protein
MTWIPKAHNLTRMTKSTGSVIGMIGAGQACQIASATDNRIDNWVGSVVLLLGRVFEREGLAPLAVMQCPQLSHNCKGCGPAVQSR